MKIDIKRLSFNYKSNSVLKGISFEVTEHEIVAILGPNGVGKSTLLKCINKILEFKNGTILIGKDDIHSLSQLEIVSGKIGTILLRESHVKNNLI